MRQSADVGKHHSRGDDCLAKPVEIGNLEFVHHPDQQCQSRAWVIRVGMSALQPLPLLPLGRVKTKSNLVVAPQADVWLQHNICRNGPRRRSASLNFECVSCYVSSKLMCWVALDRASALAEIRGGPRSWQRHGRNGG